MMKSFRRYIKKEKEQNNVKECIKSTTREKKKERIHTLNLLIHLTQLCVHMMLINER
jgi:hypothetical protein